MDAVGGFDDIKIVQEEATEAVLTFKNDGGRQTTVTVTSDTAFTLDEADFVL